MFPSHTAPVLPTLALWCEAVNSWVTSIQFSVRVPVLSEHTTFTQPAAAYMGGELNVNIGILNFPISSYCTFSHKSTPEHLFSDIDQKMKVLILARIAPHSSNIRKVKIVFV